MNNDRAERRGFVTLMRAVYATVVLLFLMAYVAAYLKCGMQFKRPNFIRRMYSHPALVYGFYPVAWAESTITGRSVSVGLIHGRAELYRIRRR